MNPNEAMSYQRFKLLFTLFPALMLMLNTAAWGQSDHDPQAIRQALQQYRTQHERAILEELLQFVAIPNVASDRENILRNAEFIQAMLARRGIAAQLLEVEGAPPVVYGELVAPDAEHTIVLYVHYDGQPVNRDAWASDPWKPVIRDAALEEGGQIIPAEQLQSPVDGAWRIYGRSSSDDKAPLVAVLAAIDALQAANIPLSVNVKFFLEGEEEAGSPHLTEILHKYRDMLEADAWLLCDGPVHQTRRMQLLFGARGITGATMTVYGPARPLHSGHYGNWAPNPIALLVHLLDSMRDRDGRILIDGFYEDVVPITETERRAVAESPSVDAQLRHELGLARTEGSGERLEELIMLPAVNFRGIRSGGLAPRNAIQTKATAVVGFRLVPNLTPEKVRPLVESHIREQGFHIVHQAPDMATRRQHPDIVQFTWGSGYPPGRTSMDLPVSQALIRVVEEAAGEPIVKLPTAGGSIPIYLFKQALDDVPVIIVPIVNHDNNQHAENENLRIQNLWDGIEIYGSILARLGHAW